jgi:glutathione synthase/RimK-type ligase-like ATP-grasp enzyme
MRRPALLGIYREQVFSPGKVQADADVLDAALSGLSSMGFKIESRRAEILESTVPQSEIVITMAQSDRVLNILEQWGESGCRIINTAKSVRNCYRKRLIRMLSEAGIPVPAGYLVELGKADELGGFSKPLWLKRGDVHAVQEGDVTAVPSPKCLRAALKHFRKIGVHDLVVQEHIEGPVVKFYGVGQQLFFRAYLESSGEEITSEMDSLRTIAALSAAVLGVEVYGGDAVLTDRGPILIDFNDWPSFSKCCQSAGMAIADYVRSLLESRTACKCEFNPGTTRT